MVAYLSINHLGYCMLGLFAIAATSVVPSAEAQAALERRLSANSESRNYGRGALLFRRATRTTAGARGLDDFGGLMQRTPILCGWMSVAMFSSLGLPGLNGFVGEFLIFKGSFALAAGYTAVAVLGLLVTAIVFLRAMQALFSGPPRGKLFQTPELHRSEGWVVVPVTLLMFALGSRRNSFAQFSTKPSPSWARLLG